MFALPYLPYVHLYQPGRGAGGSGYDVTSTHDFVVSRQKRSGNANIGDVQVQIEGKEFILRSYSPWVHRHIYTKPDIGDKPLRQLDWLEPV